MTVVFLGVITSALSLLALVRLLSTATAPRIERGRDNVETETARLASATADRRAALLESPRAQVIGMRGGFFKKEPGAVTLAEAGVPDGWRAAIDEALGRAGHGEVVTLEAPIVDGTLVVSARPAPSDVVTWAAYPIRTPPYLDGWRWIVLALSVVTLLLVLTAVHAVIVVKRSAGALNAALVGLARDLNTPVPRPPLYELREIADGIAALAQSLARSQTAEERLGRELAQQERLAALGRVVAGVAHEVRNPLASIKLRLDLAASTTPPLPAPVEQAVSHASSEIARLDRLVADLLLVAGRALGPRRRLDVGTLVRERAAALAPWAQLRRVAVTVEGDARADVDPDSIARALDNLLRNAIEASPAGAQVAVQVLEDDDGVHIDVEDRGDGVVDDRVAELFEPFFTTKAEGTGLGLAISRAIARAHGGDVMYSRAGAATRFSLALPGRSGARLEVPRAATA